jgi:hypothetical protein
MIMLEIFCAQNAFAGGSRTNTGQFFQNFRATCNNLAVFLRVNIFAKAL